MSDNFQSKVNTALISVTLLCASAGLKFWRDISIAVAEINQRQIYATAYADDLRARILSVEQRVGMNEREINKLKVQVGMK